MRQTPLPVAEADVADAVMTLAQALAIVRSQLARTVGSETVPLEAARNRLLAGDLVATVDLPPSDSAAVDGFALRFADLSPAQASPLTVVGTATAGNPFSGVVGAGQAVRIFTGAVLPDGADTVVMQEVCRAAGERVTVPDEVRVGEHCRRRGEDVRTGSLVQR